MLHKYTFTFKKGDIYLEVVTDDKAYVARELEKWINSMSSTSKPTNPMNMLKETYEDTRKSLDKSYEREEVPPQKIEESPKLAPKVEVKAEEESKFNNVLSSKLDEKPSEEIIEKQEAEAKKVIASIKQVITSKEPETMLDYLMIASYYLTEFEGLERFSIKQINAKIFAFAKKPIDHALIQKAVNNGYLKVVPDYTGMADVTEYEITPEGEEYFLNEI